MIRTALAAALLGLMSVALPGRAETFRVDDSASVVEGGQVRMKWDEVAPVAGSSSQLTGRMRVQARLDLAPWRGRQGRIYLTLPMDAVPVTAHWTSRGRLLPGTLRSGDRTLVYAGPITADRLEDTLDFTLHADGRRLQRDEQLEFVFEIDLETP